MGIHTSSPPDNTPAKLAIPGLESVRYFSSRSSNSNNNSAIKIKLWLCKATVKCSMYKRLEKINITLSNTANSGNKINISCGNLPITCSTNGLVSELKAFSAFSVNSFENSFDKELLDYKDLVF